MKKNIPQIIPTILTLLAVTAAPISYWCVFTNGACHNTWISHIELEITNPSYAFALYFLPVAILLIFVSRDVFRSWLRFAAWALPLAFVYIAMIPVNFTGIGIDLFPFYRDDAARAAGAVVAIASIVLIAWKYVHAKWPRSDSHQPKSPSGVD